MVSRRARVVLPRWQQDDGVADWHRRYTAGRPVELFDYSGFLLSSPGYPTYDVTPDGRFVMIKAENEDASRNQINVVLNWAASLARPK